MQDYLIRKAKPSDLNFILATFSKSMKSDSGLGRSTSNRVFFAGFTEVIDYILSIATIIIAHELDNQDTILGYLIYQNPDIIFYAYTKELFQEMGIARGLVDYAFPEGKALYFTCLTKDARNINSKYPELIYDPFILFKRGVANG